MLQISAKISAPVIFSKAMIRFVLMALFSVTIAGCGSGGGGGASLTPEPTIASFTSDVTEGPYDLLVQFTDTTSGSVEGWLWDFGDGSTSTDQNPSHIYTDSGSFTVSLTATGALESDTTVCQDCILVTSPAPIANFEPDTTSGTYDLPVNFVDLSTGPIDSWLWDFGDGNTSSLQNPAHVYGSEGIYSVSLLVEGPGGSDTMTCDSCITVSAPPPVANFDASPTTGVRDLLVQFTDSSTGPVSSWLWNFGDGSTSDLQNPEHLYTAAGSFEVTLEVTGPGGSDTMICSSCITVEEQAPSAAFTPSTTSGVRDLEVTFQDDSVGVITEWSWDFGDGNTSLDQSPTHTYTEAGLYTVSLTVTGPGGQDIETCASCIEVLHPAPVADFSFDPASGTYDLEVQFTDSSTGPITSWSWDFGDGSSSTEQNPLHVYSEAGSYSVTLTVEGPGGSDLITCNGCIDVSHPAPTAGFTSSGTQGDYDLLVEFTNTSTGPISEYLWDFGDGSTSSEPSPTHVYTTAGSYDVSLTVSGPGGTDTVVCQSCIVVTHPVPVSDFEVSLTRGDYPLTIQFSDLSTGPINIWAWDFGDGSTSNLQNPEHVYTEAGSYNVTLTVIGPGGTDSSSCASCITVTSPAPVASFDVSQTSGDYDLPVTFTSTSTGPVDSYLWDFGDGSSSTEANPTHTYTEAGLYSVLLTVTGPGGANSALCNSCINVTHPVPQASFSTSTSGGEYDLPVTFTSTSTGTIDALTWNFGDGSTSSESNPTHTYTEAGTYTVTLTASGPGGDDTEVCSACITVEHPAPVAGFTPSTTSGIYDLPVTFTNTSTGEISSLAWDFGDGATSSALNPTHTYTEAGTYTVTLTASGPGGDDAEICSACITVEHPAPVARFNPSVTSGTYDLAVQFANTSIGPIDTYLWDFGDGSTSTEESPVHIYTGEGLFTITLTATGPGGSSTETCSSCISVDHPAPVAAFTLSTTSGTYDLLIDFTSSSTGPIDSLLWNFGDGNTSTSQNPSHTYLSAGTFDVSLTVSGPGGSDQEICSSCIVVLDPAPVASFDASTTSGVYDLPVSFNNTSSGPVSSYQWSFGDGATSSESSPTHVYSEAGIFTVSLTATGPGGTDTYTCASCIVVGSPAPIAGFSTSSTSGDWDLEVQFTNSSSGPITDYSWNFGDGNTSAEENPMHTYTAAGSYLVSLTVSGPGGSDTEICSACITVTDPAPVADFVIAPATGVLDLLVTFTDLSTGPITSYAWNFGDGGTSTESSPNHVYTIAGAYTVSLTVTGPGGSDTRTCIECVNIQEPAPVAEFFATPVGGIYDLSIGFTDLSTGVITDWLWEFGDGATSTEQNPTHAYALSGSYDVTLTVTGPGGSDSKICLGCAEVQSPPPIASFEISATSGEFPLTVEFTDTTAGEATFWFWNFGDGGNSILQNPTHTFMSAGTYTVSLVVNGPGGTDNFICPACVTISTPPPYRLRAQSTSVALLETTQISIALDHNSSGETVQAWSYGLCHDESSLECLSAADGLGLSDINNGAEPDFSLTRLETNGFTAGVVISFSSSASLPMVNDLEINVATYTGIQEGTTSLQFCNSLGTPNIAVVIVADTISHTPVTVPGEVTVTSAP